MNMDHPNQDTDPENDEISICEICKTNAGIFGTEADPLCYRCFYAEHGPDNDKDLDPERFLPMDYANNLINKEIK